MHVSNAVQQVKKFKYLEVGFTSGRRRKKISTWTGKANAVLREFYCSVVTRPELSNTANLSVCKSV